MLQTLTDYARKRYSGKTHYSKNAMAKFELIELLVGYGQNLLELGSGDGTLSKMLSRLSAVNSLDIKDCDLQVDNIPYPENRFQTVVCCELIEHIWDSDRFLQEISYDGFAHLCCMDFEANYKYGSVKDESLKDMWKFHPARQIHKDKQWDTIPICKGCNYNSHSKSPWWVR